MAKTQEIVKLEAQPRTECGSRAVNRLRRSGWLPAVVYENGGQARPLKCNRHAFELMVRRHGGQNLILDLQVGEAAPIKVLLKDVQYDHITDHMLHVDFLAISMTRKIRIDVAIHLVGEPVGVTSQGGILEQLVRTVEVECLPTDIVQEISLDVSHLNVDESVFVRDLKVPAGLTVVTPAHIAVAAVHLPAAEEEEAKPAEEAAAEGAAPAEGAAAEGAAPAEGAAAAGGAKTAGAAKEAKGKAGEEAKADEKGKEKKEKK